MNTLTAQRTTASVPKPAAKLILQVYERNGSTQGALLATYEQPVTDLGATTWEELALGAELNQSVYLKVTIENPTATMLARFDDLKIEVFNAPTAMVVQENSYYPFGLNMRGLDYVMTPSKEDKFQYNGKEKENDFGLGWDDFGARRRDRDRWTSIDPSAEKYESISPYAYAFNNPIRFIDIKGKDPGDVVVIFAGGNPFTLISNPLSVLPWEGEMGEAFNSINGSEHLCTCL